MARDGTGSISDAGAEPRSERSWAVLYDADCGFCRWSLARLLAVDRARSMRPIALGSTEADALLSDLKPEERAASWHLMSPSGGRTSAGAAAVPLLRLLPGGRLPAALLASMPRFTERAYAWVAGHRSMLSRAIPEGAKASATERIQRHAEAAELRR